MAPDPRMKSLLSTLAWPAGGAAVGVAVGLAAARPESAAGFATAASLLTLALVAGAGAAWAYRKFQRRQRTRDTPAPAMTQAQRENATAKAATANLATPDPVAPATLAINLDDIPTDLADVWGVGDKLAVTVRLTRAGAPVAGALVRLTEGPREIAQATTDADGRVLAHATPAHEGDFALVAHAPDLKQHPEARAKRTVRVVRYEREIPRLVDDLREWALENVPGCNPTMTMREIADAIARGRGARASEATLEVLRIYEILKYGERPADRALYLRLGDAFAALEAAGALEAPGEARRDA